MTNNLIQYLEGKITARYEPREIEDFERGVTEKFWIREFPVGVFKEDISTEIETYYLSKGLKKVRCIGFALKFEGRGEKVGVTLSVDEKLRQAVVTTNDLTKSLGDIEVN